MSTRTAIASVAEEQQGFFSPKWLLRASEPHPVFSQVLDSIQKERKKSVRNLPEGKLERRRATAAAVLISSRMAMREEIRSPRRQRIDQQGRIEQAFTSGTPW
jgi:hypothetical protein